MCAESAVHRPCLSQGLRTQLPDLEVLRTAVAVSAVTGIEKNGGGAPLQNERDFIPANPCTEILLPDRGKPAAAVSEVALIHRDCEW